MASLIPVGRCSCATWVLRTCGNNHKCCGFTDKVTFIDSSVELENYFCENVENRLKEASYIVFYYKENKIVMG